MCLRTVCIDQSPTKKSPTETCTAATATVLMAGGIQLWRPKKNAEDLDLD